MLKRKELLTTAALALVMLMTACGGQKEDVPDDSANGSINEISLNDNNKEDPDDEENDELQKPDEAKRINVKAAVVGDCTGIGFAPIMGWGEKDKNHEKYELSVKATADEAAAELESGAADVAILPLDKAVRMYNDGKDIVLLATNTYNNIYIADLSSIGTEKSALAGQTVVYVNDGSLTASVAEKILEKAGAQAQSAESGDSLQAALESSSVKLAVTSEPYITRAKMQNDNIELGPDVKELWADVDGSEIISSVLVARGSFVKDNADSMIYIMDDFRQSVNTVIYGVTKTLEYSSKFNIVADKSEAISSMKNCNFTFTEGEDMKRAVQSFLGANSAVFGDKLPDDGFYYIG
ncbi:MAG: hypothetical protein IKS17_11050 [Firmicutes bacterium]|nr:hypothetical protein [Bacillota bacterium]